MAEQAKTNKGAEAAKQVKAGSSERPVTLTIASLAFAFSGVINLLLFSYLLLLSNPALFGILNVPSQLYMRAAPGVPVVLDFVAAYGLWNMRLYGGIVGIVDLVVLVANVLIGVYPQPSFDIFSIAFFLVNIFPLVLVVINWKYLE